MSDALNDVRDHYRATGLTGITVTVHLTSRLGEAALAKGRSAE